MTAGLATLRAAAQRHGINRERGHEHTGAAESIRERPARILDWRIDHEETGPEHGKEGICERLGRILGQEAGQAEPEAGGSEPGHEARSIRERLQAVLAREKQGVREKPAHERKGGMHRHRDREDGHEL